MKRIKKMMMITIMLFITFCIFSHNKSYADGYSTWYSNPTTAFNVNNTVSVSSYSKSRKILCTNIQQSAKKASSSNKFTVRARIKIVGATAEGSYLNSKSQVATTSKTNCWNKYLAYYLANGARSQDGFHGTDAFQSSFWQVIASWKTNVGSNFNLGAVIGKSSRGTAQATTLKNNASAYADSIYGITDQTGTINFYNYSNQYDIVGPFKFKFAGKISAMTVGGTAYTTVYTDSAGTTSKNISAITSGSNFYIKVPKTIGSTFKVKITTKIENALGVHLLFLKHKSSYQPLVLYKTFKQDITYSYEKTIKSNSTDITIIKQDTDTKKGLENVGFIVYCDGVGYLKETSTNTYSYVNLKNNATIFYTKFDEEGEVASLTIKDIKQTGVYKIYEVENPNDGYESGSIDNPIYMGKVDCSSLGSDKKITLNNKRKYIKIEGYVWEDIPWAEGKETVTNGLYLEENQYTSEETEDVEDAEEVEEVLEEKKDKNDKLVQNVTVRLREVGSEDLVPFINSEGEEVTEVKTDVNGAYIMYNVEIDKLDKYYVEFLYNGMSYTNVNVTLGKSNGSKASEGQNRTDYNSKYATVVQGGTTDESGNRVYDLTYNTGDYTSSIKYGENLEYGYEGQKYPVSGTYENFMITANTYNAIGGGLDQIISKEEIIENQVTEIIDINLGIVERSQPDLSLVKDLLIAKVKVNNKEHIYKYADRFNPNYYATYDDQGQSGYEMSPQVKFGQKYGSMSYTRALYASDIYTLKEDSGVSDKLSVKVIYKIGVKNVSNTLNAIINQLQDYYDSKYILSAIGTEYDETNNTIKESSKLQQGSGYEVVQSEYGDYQKIVVNPNLSLGPQTEGYIYVELDVKSESIIDIIDNGEDVKLDNVAEIASYSIKDTDGETYAGIDVDSQPGSLDINNIKTYEDDTDKAPGLLLILQEKRETSGIVFEDLDPDDLTKEKVMTNQIREGNGQYDSGEVGISGVKVILRDSSTGNIAKIYDEEEKIWKDAISETDSDGTYVIGGYLPGDYYIEYEWGDSNYKVQDYKATIVDENVYKARQTDKFWYKQDVDIRLSDATDNYDLRKVIDQQIETMTYGVEQQIENSYLPETAEADKLINKMSSTTADFSVNLEKNTDGESNVTNIRDEYELNEDGSIKFENGYPKRKDGFNVKISNVDFGIIQRAKQELTLEKQVESAKIVLTNGTILINAEIDSATGKLKDEVKDTVFIPESEGASAQLKVEIDAEIIHGATLDITYQLRAINTSELDYVNELYYMYGSNSGNTTNIVKLSPSTIIDYLDNNITTDIDQNADWNYLNEQEKNELRIPASGNLEEQLLIDSEEMKQQFINSTAITTEKLSGELKPGESTGRVKLSGYKVLSSNDETLLENNAEIIEIEKNGGSTLTTIPGNYTVSDTSTYEVDNATSAGLAIVPPTGANKVVIYYTLLAISSLGILVAGIILIKKYVLK